MELTSYFYLLYTALFLGALLLGSVFLHYHRVYSRQYLALWSAGFLVMAVANLATGISLALVPDVPAAHPGRIILSLIGAIGSYLQVFALIGGIWQLGAGAEALPRRRLALGTTIISLFGAVTVLLYAFEPDAGQERIFFRVTVRYLILGVSAVAASFWLLRLGRWRTGFGPRVVGLGFAVYGAAQLVLGASTFLQLILGVVLAFSPYLTVLDTVAQFAIGLGLVIWLLEQERQRARVADREAEFRRHHDHLTRLPNREAGAGKLARLISNADARTSQIVVAHLALDRFKQINASVGRWAGDEVLRQLGDRLRSLPSTNGFSARVQSDEFLIVQGQPAEAGSIPRWARSVLATATKPFDVGGRSLELDASLGIAIWPSDGTTEEALLKQADLAMQRVKSKGGRSVGFYAPELDEAIRRSYRLQAELREAIAESQLVFQYQPVMSAADERIVGVETLVRWEHPRRGLLLPGEFLHHARAINLMPEIDRLAMRAGLSDAQHWREFAPRGFSIAVNASAETFQSAELEQHIAWAREADPASHFRLEIEITEQTALAEIARSAARIERLQRLGISVALDDFGAGYSSLGYLRELKTPIIKLDRAFISQAPDDQDSIAILEAIVPMLHRLGRHVVAEGISGRRQREFVRTLKVDFVQGFYYYRPLDVEGIRGLLSTQINQEQAVG